MALPLRGGSESQHKVNNMPQRSHQHLAAYYSSFPGCSHYRNLATTEDFQTFGKLAAAMPASQAMAPLNAFRMATPLLNPGLAVQSEPLYNLPWYNKSPWYTTPHFTPEVPRFLDSPEYSSSTSSSQDLVPFGGQSNRSQWRGAENLLLPPPVNSSLLPDGLKTPQSVLVPQTLNREGELTLPKFNFSEEELHFVLYGVISSPGHPAGIHHAISGILIPPDSSGSNCLPKILDKDSLQLPEGLCLMQTEFGDVPHFGVFCSNFIAEGVRFGPFQGKVVNASEVKTHRDNSRMWEIFEDGNLSHFVDGKGSGNWMSYVNCARFPKEQNLVAVQHQGQIFYESCREIHQNQELLVWYGKCYEKFLEIPMSLQVTEQGKQLSEPSEESAEGYRCERCGKVFTYKYYRDKHLKYTPCVDKGDRKFPCSFCQRSFEKRDRLRIHILHVHERHRPYLCSTCGKSFSQSSSLNKHMRVHSGDRPYQCVYCTKKFTASSILRTHIRQHSGEKPFKCKHCGKPFASHAAHDSHVRRSHKEDDRATCSICGKGFLNQEDFRAHMKFHKDPESRAK
ncbi:PR domain zinc finger protein 14 [Cricetulus griseus]|uniref:PR domain zinc finger protein 14 n=1 Tax=Cricetulus griseus TaxID=10029 RepID=G3I8G4_CRIGR|nr:PR domain zinc finger protein 14 [Cricetulus griseus]EGW14634.1 PR domain zinc finger protein 14 [Cricetulus griseus]